MGRPGGIGVLDAGVAGWRSRRACWGHLAQVERFVGWGVDGGPAGAGGDSRGPCGVGAVWVRGWVRCGMLYHAIGYIISYTIYCDAIRCGAAGDMMRICTIRYDTIRYDKVPYDTVRYYTTTYDTIANRVITRYDTALNVTKRYGTIMYDTVRRDTLWCDMRRCDAILHDTMRCGAARYETLRYDILRYGTMLYDLI